MPFSRKGSGNELKMATNEGETSPRPKSTFCDTTVAVEDGNVNIGYVRQCSDHIDIVFHTAVVMYYSVDILICEYTRVKEYQINIVKTSAPQQQMMQQQMMQMMMQMMMM